MNQEDWSTRHYPFLSHLIICGRLCAGRSGWTDCPTDPVASGWRQAPAAKFASVRHCWSRLPMSRRRIS